MNATDLREHPAGWAPSQGSAADRLRLRLLISVSVAAALWYFTWLLQPARIGNPVLYGLLLVAEFFNVVQAMGFWWTSSRHSHRQHSPPPPAGWSVDLLIPVYNEPLEIIEPVIRACLRLRSVPVRVVVLDDGKSDELRELTSRLGADYLRRPTNRGAKAGNINAALARTSAPFVAVLDCDHVPDVRFLEATVGHFADERVAFVQTPQFYANARQRAVAAAAWSQQALFFGGISVGKDAMGAMFCCGTNVIFRRAALEEVGGFPEDSITEDFQMSVTFHSRGWRSVYVPEVLARGLGPEDMASYVSQQLRWARGCISAIPSVLRARLPMRLRLQYLLSAGYFLYGWTVLIYMFMPVARITLDAQPVASTSSAIFLWHFAPYFLLCMATVARAGGGSYTFSAFALAAANFWIGIISTLRAVLRRPASFVVTPKSGAGEWQPRVVVPSLVAAGVLIAVSVWGLVVNPTPGVFNAAAFALVHAAILFRGAAPALNLAERRPPLRVGSSRPPTKADREPAGTALSSPAVPARAEQPSTIAFLKGTT